MIDILNANVIYKEDEVEHVQVRFNMTDERDMNVGGHVTLDHLEYENANTTNELRLIVKERLMTYLETV